MQKTPRRKKFVVVLAVLLVLEVVACFFLPWKWLAEHKLVRMLEKRGLTNVHLSVADLGLSGVKLKDISIGAAHPLTLENVTVGYELSQLLHGNFEGLTLSGLHLQAVKQPSGWALTGLEGLKQQGGALSLPVTPEQMAGIPLASGKLEKSDIEVLGEGWQMTLPLALEWKKTPVPTLTYKGDGMLWKQQGMGVNAAQVLASVALFAPDKTWKGTWQLKGMGFKQMPLDLPALDGAGAIAAQEDSVTFNGRLMSADKSVSAVFAGVYALNAPDKSYLNLAGTSMPFSGGRVSVGSVHLPLMGNAPLKADIKIEHVSIDALMQSVTGKRATATGQVSGTLPVTLGGPQGFSIGESALASEQPGIIQVLPDAIPGDNEQVALVREVLRNFHYKTLSLGFTAGKGGALTLLLSVEGNNPDAYNGHPVKLNVKFTGDVLNLFRQNAAALSDPTSLLKKGAYAK